MGHTSRHWAARRHVVAALGHPRALPRKVLMAFVRCLLAGCAEAEKAGVDLNLFPPRWA